MPGCHRTLFCSLTFCLLVLLAGCAAPQVKSLPQLPRETLQAALQQQQQQFTGVSAMAKVQIDNRGETLASDQALLVALPDRLRSETLSMFGQPLLSLASEAGELEVFIPSRQQFLRGEASAANLLRYARLPLTVDELVRLLLHRVPLLVASEVVAKPGPVLELSGDRGFRQILYFDEQTRLVGADYFDSRGELWLQLGYADFAAQNGFPTRMELTLPQDRISASVRLSDIEVNPVIADNKFRLKVPEGISPQPFPN